MSTNDASVIKSSQQARVNDAPAVNPIFGAAQNKMSLEAQSLMAAKTTRPRETALPEAADFTTQHTAMSRMTGVQQPPKGDVGSSKAQVDAMLNGFQIAGQDKNTSAKSTALETVVASASNGKGLAANRPNPHEDYELKHKAA